MLAMVVTYNSEHNAGDHQSQPQADSPAGVPQAGCGDLARGEANGEWWVRNVASFQKDCNNSPLFKM